MIRERLQYIFSSAPLPLKKIRQEKTFNKKRFFISRGIAAGALILNLVFLTLLKQSEAVAEWFTRHISQLFTATAGRITSLLGLFSLIEFLVICAILYGIKLIISWIISLFKIKKRYITLLKSMLVTFVAVMVIVNLYTVCAGFAYYRAPLKLPSSDIIYMNEQVEDIADYFYNDFIELSGSFKRDKNGNAIPPYNKLSLAQKMREEFKRLDSDPYFFKYTPLVKTVKNSWFLSSSRIAGIAFLPTGEANINSMPLFSSLPATMAHELAHTKGVMRENEAELVSFYILLTSKDSYLRYCGYLECIKRMRSAVITGYNDDDLKKEKGNKFALLFPEDAQNEINNAYKFWDEYVGPFDWLNDFLAKINKFFNDLYLKSNGVDEGENSYVIPPGEVIEIPNPNPDPTRPDDPPFIRIPSYDPIQKIFFKIYEDR